MSKKAPDKAQSRDIPLPVRCTLWGMAAGRCEFRGCNQIVYRHPETKEFANISEAAHIVGFSKDGPRGEDELSEDLAKDVTNLMLLCRNCHKTIDTNKQSYPVELLHQMKQAHEKRIEIASGVDENAKSYILLYGANIGAQNSCLSYRETATALFPNCQPAEATAIELGTINSSFRDKSEMFWAAESAQLRNLVEQRVLPRLASGEIKHLSFFSLAPQPLLVLFGSLITDIHPAQVYQRHREPPSWRWQKNPEGFRYVVREPLRKGKIPALVLSLSATIVEDRITCVLGNDAAIWHLTIDQPHNDFMKAPEQLRMFRETMRPLMDRIKAMHGQNTVLHVFPAAPVSICVELGRIRMPKADMPLCLYDQNTENGGFVKAFEIGGR